MRTLGLLLAIVVAACGSSSPSSAPPVPADAARQLVVMSYNVNFGLGGDGEGLAAIRRGNADVVVLQETTEAWELAIRAHLADLYPHMRFRHCCGAGGLAFLSRHPIDEREYVPPIDDGWFPAWRVIVATPVGKVQVLAVHLHPPLDANGSVLAGYFPSKAVRRREIEAFAPLLDADPELPALVVGDFNEDAEGAALRFLAGRGLRSALAVLDPTATTWRWGTSVGTVTGRLDHVVHDPRLVAVDARVMKVGNSDHFPVLATFTMP